jgi:uncharacterized protein YecE (DUF72 family)
MMSNLRIGTSGWSYPSGRGTWNGIFYPTGRGRGGRAGVDELTYYAERFDTVEVNTTFYGQPKPEICRRWVERTPEGFAFSLKLYQKFTHPVMYEKATGRSDARTGTPGVPRLDPDDVDTFRRGIDPIAGAGRLGALLAQFPPSFKESPEARDYLDWLLRVFGEYQIAVELRHRSWSDNVADTLTLLNAHGAAWAQIDEPKFRFSIRQNQLPNVKGFYYMRLHGRNAAKWWRHEHAEERYDYLYSPDELKFFAETADAARTLVKKLYLYLNNHFAAKSAANALMIKHQLGQPIIGSYPPPFVERYPQLTGIVSTGQPTGARTFSLTS